MSSRNRRMLCSRPRFFTLCFDASNPLRCGTCTNVNTLRCPGRADLCQRCLNTSGMFELQYASKRWKCLADSELMKVTDILIEAPKSCQQAEAEQIAHSGSLPDGGVRIERLRPTCETTAVTFVPSLAAVTRTWPPAKDVPQSPILMISTSAPRELCTQKDEASYSS